MPVQIINTEMVGLLESHFQPRHEPNFAWKSCVSAFLALPALRGFWPMSAINDANPQVMDVSGNAYPLTNNNSADFGFDELAPYANFDGSNQYLSRADGGAANWADIRGNEAYVLSGQQGLTFGGWFWTDDTTNAQYLMSKRSVGAGNYSYWIQLRAGGQVRAQISNDGTAVVTADGDTIGDSVWFFAVARFVPSTELSVFVNHSETVQAAGVPATVFDSNADFCVGAYTGPTSPLEGRASLCFLCAAALSDAILFSLYHQTRVMYDV